MTPSSITRFFHTPIPLESTCSCPEASGGFFVYICALLSLCCCNYNSSHHDSAGDIRLSPCGTKRMQTAVWGASSRSSVRHLICRDMSADLCSGIKGIRRTWSNWPWQMHLILHCYYMCAYQLIQPYLSMSFVAISSQPSRSSYLVFYIDQFMDFLPDAWMCLLL